MVEVNVSFKLPSKICHNIEGDLAEAIKDLIVTGAIEYTSPAVTDFKVSAIRQGDRLAA